jgi:pSer/pThr/pTyr-binding forkhead associated (FHA) protein
MILVRTGDREFPTGTCYVVFGIVTQNSRGQLELQEHIRRPPHADTPFGTTEAPALWSTGEPPTAETPKGEIPPGPGGPSGAKKETQASEGGGKGFPNWALYAIGAFFIVLAVVLGAYVSWKQKQAREQQWQEEQRRISDERARMHEQLLQAQKAGTPLAETQAVAPTAPKGTIEAWGRVEVVEGPGKGQVFPLAGREIVVGRSEGDVRLGSDEAVSSRHGTLAQTNDGRLLYIDNSRNGSVVDGKPVHRAQAELRDGSVIQVGVSRLKVNVVMPAMASSAPRPGGDAGPTVAVPASSLPTQAFTGCELQVVTGRAAGTNFPLSKTTISIGREERNDITLPDETVSRTHATLRLEAGTYVFTNESSQGSSINGKPATQQPLKSGDEIQMGAVKLKFTEEV